jgi:hypothetical protein
MNDGNHLAKLAKAANIGIALGKVSNGLVTIDLDQDSYVDAFLGANPLLTKTLRTRGSRGCNVWVRCSSGYPPSQKLKNSSGDEIGEWRADGNQTIISGTHPEGMPYQFAAEHPAITVGYEAIIWPESILPPNATESKRVRGVGENKVVSVSIASVSSSLIEGFSPKDSISQLAPTGHHQNNASLFKLARLVKSYENAVGRPATVQELEFVFDRWCLVARRFWRPELTRDDYYAEFLEAYSYARIGLDENPIELAVSRAKATPLPDVEGFTNERIRLLVAICREMQLLTGDSPFFLPTRKLGEILGVHWTRVGRWLRAIEALRIIRLADGEVRQRGGSRSPRYYYDARGETPDALVNAPPLRQSELPALTDGNQPQKIEGVAPAMVLPMAPSGVYTGSVFPKRNLADTPKALAEGCEQRSRRRHSLRLGK